jgi:hypothetical protein
MRVFMQPHTIGLKEMVSGIRTMMWQPFDPSSEWRFSGQAAVAVMENTKGKYQTTHAQVNVRTDDIGLVNDLVTTLASMPGVVEPEVLKLTMYFGLGGLTPEMDAARVIINGKPYDFPEDFGTYEAQDLYWAFRGLSDGSVMYEAYPQTFLIKGFGKTTEEAMSSRFKLGDVIRLALDGQRNMTIDTVKQSLELPEGVKKEDGHAKGGGWLIAIPPGIDESSVDVFAELRRKIQPTDEDQKIHRYSANVETWFVPLSQVKTQGGLSITDEQKKLAARLVPALGKALEDWKTAHPEVRRSIAVGDRAHGGPYKAGVNTIGFTAGVRTDDLAEFQSLKAAIARVEGVPAIEERITDMQPVIDRYKKSPATLK